jgi:hypothetical protein
MTGSGAHRIILYPAFPRQVHGWLETELAMSEYRPVLKNTPIGFATVQQQRMLPMPTDRFIALRLQRGAEHLHKLSARATAEFLAELANRIGGTPAIIDLLNEYECLTPEVLCATGGDRFPRRIRPVPR